MSHLVGGFEWMHSVGYGNLEDMITIICDRCKRSSNGLAGSLYIGKLRWQEQDKTFSELDICSDCLRDLEAWIISSGN